MFHFVGNALVPTTIFCKYSDSLEFIQNYFSLSELKAQISFSNRLLSVVSLSIFLWTF